MVIVTKNNLIEKCFKFVFAHSRYVPPADGKIFSDIIISSLNATWECRKCAEQFLNVCHRNNSEEGGGGNERIKWVRLMLV